MKKQHHSPLNLNIIHTTDKDKNEIEQFYQPIHEFFKITKRHEMNLISGWRYRN